MINKIIFAKWIFSKPNKKDILIYDSESIEIFYLIFNKKDCECLCVRYESINFYILLTTIIKRGFKNLKDNYKFFYIKAVSPKVVFTIIDNNPAFYKLTYIYAKTIYVSIQISARTDIFLDSCKKYYLNPKSKKLKVNHMFVIGKNDINRYSKIIEGKIESLGSVKNNYFYIKKKQDIEKKINSILFISTKNKLSKFHKREKIIFDQLYKFCTKKNLKLSICTKLDLYHERIYRQHLIKGDWSYIPYVDMEKTYELINKSQMVVFCNSTLGLEAMTKKIKGVCFPEHIFPSDSYAKIYPNEGPFWFCNFVDYNRKGTLEENMEHIMEKVINYTQIEWEKIVEEYISDMVEYNEGNLKLIKLAQKYNLPLKTN